jgi:acetylornithine deacetylase/succinyl-diaminopimelate desuccinylase-like protein
VIKQKYLEEFYSLLRFPSISADEQYAEKLNSCAEWLARKLRNIGLEAESVRTKKYPIVWGRTPFDPKKRTVMIYGHHDVQSPDPLELWNSPPFEPVLKNGYIFARGATDNKGANSCAHPWCGRNDEEQSRPTGESAFRHRR